MTYIHHIRIVVVLQLIASLAINSSWATENNAEKSKANERDRPASVTAHIGDVTVRIDGRKLWTLSRIEYKNSLLGVEHSAYGTVLNLKDVGFIGTAHKEVESEDVTDLRFFLDEKYLPSPPTVVQGNSFKVKRKSRIRSFQLDSLLEVRDNRIYQSVRLQTKAAVEMKVIYPFMYAWTPTATTYMFGADNGARVEGVFAPENANQGQLFQSKMNWLAVYDKPTKKGAVSRLLTQHPAGGAHMLIVDAPKAYRKFYIMCFSEEEVPAGFDETYRIVTSFFEADNATWKSTANKLAQSLKRNR